MHGFMQAVERWNVTHAHSVCHHGAKADDSSHDHLRAEQKIACIVLRESAQPCLRSAYPRSRRTGAKPGTMSCLQVVWVTSSWTLPSRGFLLWNKCGWHSSNVEVHAAKHLLCQCLQGRCSASGTARRSCRFRVVSSKRILAKTKDRAALSTWDGLGGREQVC